MNARRCAIALSMVAVMSTAACTAPSVGTAAISWQEETQDPVGHEILRQGATLIPDQSAWDQWVRDLPADMRQVRTEALNNFTLDDSVAVVAVWSRCTESSQILNMGDGRLDFQVIVEEPQTNCAWSPQRVQVWDVPLEVLGVGREDVTLAD